jgi:hypothetical protein
MAISERLLHACARLLPKEFRERVFEPALADLEFDERTGRRRPFARAIFLAECLRIGLRQHLWRRGRLTAAAVALLVALAVGALVVTRLRYAAEWKAESMKTRAPRASVRVS